MSGFPLTGDQEISVQAYRKKKAYVRTAAKEGEEEVLVITRPKTKGGTSASAIGAAIASEGA